MGEGDSLSALKEAKLKGRISAPFLLLLCTLASELHVTAAEPNGQSKVLVPVEAELLSSLEVRKLHTGAVIYARVTQDWAGPGCVLKRGATLEANVTAITMHSKMESDSLIALSFARAQCDGSDMMPFGLMLSAVAAPDDRDSGDVTTDLPTTFGASGGSGNLRSVDQQVDPMLVNLHRFPVTANLRAGDVLDIKGLKLIVGGGPDSSSVLVRRGRDVELFKHTRLLLIPASVSNARAQPGLPLRDSSSVVKADLEIRPEPKAAEQPAEEDLDACAPPACSIASPDAASAANVRAVGSVSIVSLGYAPRPQIEIDAPGQDEALAYLSQKELLVAFNPHSLVPRHGDALTGSTVRVIRAALVDVVNQRVIRTVDWHLPDRKQFLWLLAQHRVLVHVGNELRVYGPGLKVEEHLGLSGPLVFVRASPDGKVVAIGILKERHSDELHHKLRESLGQEPEEDVEILILNERFEAVATTMSTSDRLPPTLLNEGQLKLVLQAGQNESPEKHYHLTLRTWDNLSQSVARFGSTCTPQLSSLAPDLILLVTCDSANQAREYRVMHADGRLVLRGKSMLKQLGHTAIGDADTKNFAVKIFEADQPLLPGEMFHPADLESAELGVYRSEGGKQLFSVRVSDPAATAGGYAMSPGGGQLAVLTRDRIALYAFSLDVK